MQASLAGRTNRRYGRSLTPLCDIAHNWAMFLAPDFTAFPVRLAATPAAEGRDGGALEYPGEGQPALGYPLFGGRGGVRERPPLNGDWHDRQRRRVARGRPFILRRKDLLRLNPASTLTCYRKDGGDLPNIEPFNSIDQAFLPRLCQHAGHSHFWRVDSLLGACFPNSGPVGPNRP